MRITVTGAYGFSGKYMARRLLDLRHEVITLTNSPHRSNPFGESVKAFLYNFSEPKELEKSLRGIDVLINTYWVRFDKPSHFTFAQALANTKVLFDAAKRAGVGRVVHISITNPDRAASSSPSRPSTAPGSTSSRGSSPSSPARFYVTSAWHQNRSSRSASWPASRMSIANPVIHTWSYKLAEAA
jgi:nucleoside-diphosphate-sugar epimerase